MNNILIQHLKAYPQSIFDLELKVMSALKARNQAKSDIDFYLLGVDEEIAKSKELKNETMRKAARQEHMVDSAIYHQLTEKLEQCDREYRIAQFELERTKNEFSVAKIEARMSINYSEQVA